MKSAIAVFMILAVISPPVFGDEKKVCEPCKGKTRVVKKHIRRVKKRFDLKCYYPVIVIKQEQSVVVKNVPPTAASKPISPPSTLPKKIKKVKAQWWWIGLGAFATGLWAGERDFFPGVHGMLIFAINKRFRVGGNIGVGYGPWQQNGRLDVWFGGTFAVRAYKGLFVNFGAETMWGGFDGLSVHRRMIAASSGPEYWFGERASISLRFLVGVADLVGDCQIKSGQVVGGNIFTISVYF